MFDIYSDIAKRTGGDIYLGVVGPVRTGKSTFIKKFMETLVLDKIEDKNKRARAIDELPQSGDGKTIMTTEPKFVPNEAVKLSLDNSYANFRLIDCVGYIVDSAIGHTEGEKQRLVKTPWSDKEMPFAEAAELGTSKVIREHSTIGIVVTTDGSITDIKRSKYIDAEERVIKELKEINKPFVVLMNSTHPNNEDTVNLAQSLSEKYAVTVMPMDIENATAEMLSNVMQEILMQFPIKRVDIDIPRWMRALAKTNPIVTEIMATIKDNDLKVCKMADYKKLSSIFANSDNLEKEADINLDSSKGIIKLTFKAKEGLFYKVMQGECSEDVSDDYKLLSYIIKVSKSYSQYEEIRKAMDEVKETGYGVVNPAFNEMELEEPKMVKRGNQFGVKLSASAPSLHIIRVDVNTEISPIIGTAQQSEELVKHLLSEYERDKKTIWNTNMFGKSLSSLVSEDLNYKTSNMPEDVKIKMRKTLGRIVNESKGGVLCILL